MELALAHSAAGKTQTARKYLQNAELVANQFEHPFTCTVLLELGRLDLEAGDYQSAAKNFLEASWSAAIYQDFGVVEEALRYGALTHMLSEGQTFYPPLVAATGWAAAGKLRQLNTSLLL
ncbi:MAG: tetratricopeptide repeat protein, partial [Candidatus Saccharimonadales bacterium]